MRLYDRYVLPPLLNLAMRAPDLSVYRARLAAQADGVVLELGFGSGLNLPYYDPGRVRRLIAVDPSPGLLALARPRIDASRFPVEVLAQGAERLPLADASVDTVLSSWTLCSIAEVGAALSEARRVLRPGGKLLFVEHGRAPQPRVARWQDRLTPLWRRCAGGCHLNRRADELARAAGFEIERLDTGYMRGPKLLTFMYEGRARRP